MKHKKRILYLTYAAAVAAAYAVLTFVSSSLGMASGVVQVRLSEALCTLAYFTPAAVPGLAVGCFAANLITGCVPADIIFGTVATAVGAAAAYRIRHLHPVLSPIPSIIVNTLSVPFILKYGYGVDAGIPYLMLSVGIGEVISCGVLGIFLLYSVKKLGILKEKR